MTIKKPKVKGNYLDDIKEPLFTLGQDQLRNILDFNWYPRANNALINQRKIWDYSYLAYKGIMLWSEINRKRRENDFGIYVNVPRTFMTIEGIRRNFNINKLRVNLEPIEGISDDKRNNIGAFLNYDFKRGGTLEQIKNAGFFKLLYGNGFLYSYLAHRTGKYGNITGDIDPETAIIKNTLDKTSKTKYFGMVSRAVSPYKIIPDPDGVTHDYNDSINQPCNYTCIRHIKHINTFRRDWKGIIPDKILDKVKPGGLDMTNYEAVRETVDIIFDYSSFRYPGSIGDLVGNSKVIKSYDTREYVEERIWLGEDFFIVQAGAGLKFCIISPNPNPRKISNLTKLDDVSIPGEYWAMGEPYILRYQQIEENRIHNTVLDTLHFSICGMLGINTQYLEDDTDIEIRPQKVWKLKPMPGVKIDEMMQQFNPSSSGILPAIKFMDEVKKVGQSTTSITDFVTGASKSIAKTATESSKLSASSDLVISDKIREIAGGAMTDVARVFISMYPVAYSDEKMSAIFDKNKMCFVGKDKNDVDEKDLVKLLEKYNPHQVIFADDLDISAPEFNIVGEVSFNRSEKLNQWISAIDYAAKVNEQAYATGDRRRIDVIKMGLLGMENFDVVGNPDDFLMDNQPIKTDEIQLNAQLNAEGAQQENNIPANSTGAPAKNKITIPKGPSSILRQKAQPNNSNKNQLSRKNK